MEPHTIFNNNKLNIFIGQYCHIIICEKINKQKKNVSEEWYLAKSGISIIQFKAICSKLNLNKINGAIINIHNIISLKFHIWVLFVILRF